MPNVNWCNSIIKQMIPIFHKIILKHIFHKRKSLYMLPKLYMYVKKEVLCCKFLIFNNCNFVCFRVFLLYTSIESTCICKIFILPHPVFGRSGCRLSNSTVIFLPDVSDVWRWPNPVKIPKCSFFYY